MKTFVNHYSVLGIKDFADDALVRAAFKAAAKRTHPDGGGASDGSDFIKIKKAYDVLTEVNQRAAFDAELRQRQNKHSSSSGVHPPPRAQHGRVSPSTTNGISMAPAAPRLMILLVGVFCVGTTIYVFIEEFYRWNSEEGYLVLGTIAGAILSFFTWWSLGQWKEWSWWTAMIIGVVLSVSCWGTIPGVIILVGLSREGARRRYLSK